jgi:hypothetical protein
VSFAEALAELVAMIAKRRPFTDHAKISDTGAAGPPTRRRQRRSCPSFPTESAPLLDSPRTELETWYRGGGRQAKVKVVHVSEFGVDDVGNIVATALDQELARVEESDLEGELVYVAFREDAGEDVEAGVWGLGSGQWAVVVTADSRETRADVTAVAKTVATTGDRNLGQR